MEKRRGNFIEEHVEKIVLAVVGLACVYIFYEFVIKSPDEFSYDGREFQAGHLDIYISEQAERLKRQLGGEPNTSKVHEPCSPAFISMLEEGGWTMDKDVVWPLPSAVESRIERRYRIPTVGGVKDVAVEHIRAAAYVPKVEITTENVKKQDSYEPNDIDLVTVQGSFDLGELSGSFQECFSGSLVPEEWRDSSLARPVFAAVHLERQRLGEDGRWGEWEEVPRARIDPDSEMFRIVEDVNSLPSGVAMVRLLRFGDPQKQANLLQPGPYQIASAEEEWFPPLLHKRFLVNRREREAQERRDAIAAEREEERDKSRTERDRRTRTTRTPTGMGEMGYMEMMMGMPASAPSRGTTRGTRTERERRQEPPPTEQLRPRVIRPAGDTAIYEDLDKMLLANRDISKLREPIVFWAHDDMVEPGNSYRYRVRLGVFNPVAGTGQVRAEDQEYANKVILWGEFSDVTEAVEIPRRLYFFPVNVQETAKAVEVQVCKYAMGYWYGEQFMVKRGDVIGKIMEAKPEVNEQGRNLTVPDTIDYTTGAVVVDVVAVNDWSGGKNLQSRRYFDMLYSYDGTDIERMVAKLMYWPDELRMKYNEIRLLEKRPKEPLRAWSSASVLGGRRVLPGGPMRLPTERGGQPTTEEEEMMMMMMQMMHPSQ
jgi:hypothetical protein